MGVRFLDFRRFLGFGVDAEVSLGVLLGRLTCSLNNPQTYLHPKPYSEPETLNPKP